VSAGALSVSVPLGRPEPDPTYAVKIRTTWITNPAVTGQRADGFTVQFDRPAPAGATIDWMLMQ
jgi:hypothetical protein